MSFTVTAFVVYISGYSYLISGTTAIIPVLNPVHRNVVSSRGSNVTLTCLGRRVNALDTVVLWKFNGQEIKESTHNIAVDKFLPKRKGTFSLHITNVSEKDVGKYTCIALVANFGKADRVEDIIDLKLYESVKWPRGTYAVPMPHSGCPVSMEFSWSEGYLRQNTEDSGPLSNWSSPLHLKGEKKDNEITQHFCVKTKKAGKTRWPAGSYCIYKKGKCPRGFREGWIKWDDEDTKNDNLASGVLPDGTFAKDTILYFCCRSDGSAETPIELPMREPFFLLKHSSSCQAVMGMRVTEEWLFWDCEDRENKNSYFGDIPESFMAKDIKLYYCYYEKK
ncbi:hypothetical protein OS493_002119 [Desmophyllum pertusum]|uniref:Ig-like domain-containing protein n=1 Tax=Desmophyllum pertusum TaxID=174260 RepID=A0A9W9Z5F7_9CNID|nr:hypothetical protein OS493_002119 [Desmophyllum pertusum]